METKLDIEKLINEVHIRPALWDSTHCDYMDRIKRKECWEEITDIFVDEDTTNDDKKYLGELLHKKWKNVRDRFAREINQKEGSKTGESTRRKTPYMHAQQLQFLKDTLASKKTVNSVEQTVSENTPIKEKVSETVPSTSIPILSPKVVRPLGKKRLPPFEEQIINLLERHEKRANMETLENDDNRMFLLSLLPNLAALPRRLNTNCRIELMQCLGKYEAIQQCDLSQQTTFALPDQNHTQLQQIVPITPTEQFQQYATIQPEQFPKIEFQEPPIPGHENELWSQEQPVIDRIQIPVPVQSPTDSASTCISEEDSQFSIF